MPDSSTPILRRRALLLLIAVVVAGLIAFWTWNPADSGPDALLDNPRLALSALQARALYYNPAAIPWLAAQRPEFLSAEARDPGSERARSFAQAILEPKLFRRLDRELRFDTVLLVGDPSQYRPLLDHFGETRDFRLSYVDHTSMVYRRDAPRAWTLEDFASVRQAVGAASKRRQAACFALAGAKLAAAHRNAEAKALLDEALALDSRSAEVWSARGVLDLEQNEWAAALAATEKALAIDKNHLGALATRIQAFVVAKRFNEAYALSQKLIARLPDDPNLLFKHAQVAHQANAFKTEIATLEKLIARAEASQRPTTGYRFYLAQAHTAAGQGQPALENFARVLTDPELPEDQRKFALETIERIKRRTGL